MMALNYSRWMTGLLALLLVACSPSDNTDSKSKAKINQSQAQYFLQSLTLVEQSGRQLQAQNLTQTEVERAFLNMDKALAMAFKVTPSYLDTLDVRLAKYYQRYFIEGVQTYRIGTEAADQQAQKQGLSLLNNWAQFWGSNQSTLLKKIQPE